jgi:LmbE family N-acetylglucosaminyl deacetylase
MRSAEPPALLGTDSGPWDSVRHWLVLAPHPDDFDVVAITLRHFKLAGARISLEVLSGGASGVEDAFATPWEAKTAAREIEQLESCLQFGLPAEQIHFHRLQEDAEGHMADTLENEACIHALLNSIQADGVVLPHGNDSNADHRRTFRWFQSWSNQQATPPLALFVRDPKNLGMPINLITAYHPEQAAWKASLLRCHRSQQQRNLRTRGFGFDERILAAERAAATNFGLHAIESFHCTHSKPTPQLNQSKIQNPKSEI